MHRNILFVWIAKTFAGVILVAATFLLAGCQEEQASKETPPAKPVKYVFDKSISNSSKILCAASAGKKLRLDLVAFRVEARSRDGGQVYDLEPLGTYKECDLSKLSYDGLNNFSVAKKEVVFNIGFTFRLNLKEYNILPNISISRYAEDIEEDIKFDIDTLDVVCARLTTNINEYGFMLIESIKGCNKSIKYMQPNYTFAGINKIEKIPAMIKCTKPGGLYPDGACFLETWYKNYSTSIAFSTVDLKHWRQIRKQAFDIMDRHLVTLVNPYHCVGKFCKKIGRN